MRARARKAASAFGESATFHGYNEHRIKPKIQN
jgi:hypothetical protein